MQGSGCRVRGQVTSRRRSSASSSISISSFDFLFAAMCDVCSFTWFGYLGSQGTTLASLQLIQLHKNVQRFRGGLIFKAHRLLYHSILGLRVIKKKKKETSSWPPPDAPRLLGPLIQFDLEG